MSVDWLAPSVSYIILDTIDADYDVKLAEYRNELAYIEQSLDKVRAEWER